MAVCLSLGTQRGLGAPHPATTFCLGPIASVVEAQGVSSGRGMDGGVGVFLMAVAQARSMSGSGSMAATVMTANWQCTLSAKADRSEMLVSLLARHCALVNRGSS